MILEACLCLALTLSSPPVITTQKELTYHYATLARVIKGVTLAYKGYRMIHDSKINIRVISVRW